MYMRVICRLLVGAALLGSLGLGRQAALAETTTLHEYGYWASTLDITDKGQRACGVRTEMRGGGELRLMVFNDDVLFIAHDPDWNLQRGDTLRVRVYIDGEGFNAIARVVNSETLMVTNLTEHFLDQFIDGTQLVAVFGGVRWNVSLIGSSRAIKDMQSCIEMLRHAAPMS
jgi:hypothetical protein